MSGVATYMHFVAHRVLGSQRPLHQLARGCVEGRSDPGDLSGFVGHFFYVLVVLERGRSRVRERGREMGRG